MGLGASGLADKVILYTFPGADFFPGAAFAPPQQIALADLAFQGHAEGIQQGAALLNAQGLETVVVPLAEITDEISADPTAFGFLASGPALLGFGTDVQIVPNPASPIGVDILVPPNPAVAGLDLDQVIFFDFLHPTAATHGIFAAFTEAVLTADTVFLDDLPNKVKTSKGEDLVLAGGGDDDIKTRDGDDVIFGGLGDDKVKAGKGDDIVGGGSGDDKIKGEAGDDVLAGNAGDDDIRGGKGNDALIGGLGSDRLRGDKGDDVFFYVDAALIGGVTGADTDRIDGGKDHDTLYLVVSDAVRAEVEATLADGPGKGGRWEFEALGLEVRKVEQVVLLDSRADLDDIAAPAGLQEVLDLAELWNLV